MLAATQSSSEKRTRMNKWPNYFPEQCPPVDARNDNIQVFRLVDGAPLSAKDFRPTVIEQPHRAFEADKLCAACGVSVFRNVQDVIKKRSRFKPLRSKKIALGSITEVDGLVLETFEPTHMTWWLQTATPHINFIEHDEHDSA